MWRGRNITGWQLVRSPVRAGCKCLRDAVVRVRVRAAELARLLTGCGARASSTRSAWHAQCSSVFVRCSPLSCRWLCALASCLLTCARALACRLPSCGWLAGAGSLAQASGWQRSRRPCAHTARWLASAQERPSAPARAEKGKGARLQWSRSKRSSKRVCRRCAGRCALCTLAARSTAGSLANMALRARALFSVKAHRRALESAQEQRSAQRPAGVERPGNAAAKSNS